MDVRDFDFDLPAELIAQEPPPERGGSRLLFLNRATGRALTHTIAALPDLLGAATAGHQQHTRFPGAADRPSRAERRRSRVPAYRPRSRATGGKRWCIRARS